MCSPVCAVFSLKVCSVIHYIVTTASLRLGPGGVGGEKPHCPYYRTQFYGKSYFWHLFRTSRGCFFPKCWWHNATICMKIWKIKLRMCNHEICFFFWCQISRPKRCSGYQWHTVQPNNVLPNTVKFGKIWEEKIQKALYSLFGCYIFVIK